MLRIRVTIFMVNQKSITIYIIQYHTSIHYLFPVFFGSIADWWNSFFQHQPHLGADGQVTSYCHCGNDSGKTSWKRCLLIFFSGGCSHDSLSSMDSLGYSVNPCLWIGQNGTPSGAVMWERRKVPGPWHYR